MHSPEAVLTYSRREVLTPAEQAALDRVRDEARGMPIVDLGVGAGRTVRPLLEVSSDYLGIDYSRAMLAAARKRYPEARFEHGDARNLDRIMDESVFLVMFSCNGIDMVSFEDRAEIVREAFRILRPGGVFLFSMHNQDSSQFNPGFQFPKFHPARNPLRLAVRTIRFMRSTLARVLNRMRLRRHERHTADYSIINDVYHNYGTLLCHTTLARQRRQLEEAGFEPGAEAFGEGGRQGEPAARDHSLMLLARKPLAPQPA
jgi:ubiquinone/menaquinone biosynthesis C-methylase UbiE